jgi:predicted nucleotidyltransferase
MRTVTPNALPVAHASLLSTLVGRAQADPRVVGVLAAGSLASGAIDGYSDLDLVIVCGPEAWPAVLETRSAFASESGPLLAAFTGEHVGEPRLLICLYGPPLVHVDLKFLLPDDLARRVDEPVVVWARDARVADALAGSTAAYPRPDGQWLEDRFWVWVHYAAAKLGRGELFEALDFLAFLRGRVFGPLILDAAGAQPNGVRRLEQVAPEWMAPLAGTVAAYDPVSIGRALHAAVDLYLALRAPRTASLVVRPEAEQAARAYLAEVIATRG